MLCRLLFELLVLTGAQVGSDWTSVLKKRQEFRWVLFAFKNLKEKVDLILTLFRFLLSTFFCFSYIFRDAFSEFDAETVSKYSEKKITSISTKYSIALSQVRGIVDNSIRILQVLNFILSVIMNFYPLYFVLFFLNIFF